MKFRLHSDTHLEGMLGKSSKELCDLFFPEAADDLNTVLLLAGDICSRFYKVREVLEELSTRFYKIVYVPGNHEFYGSSLPEWMELAKRQVFPENVYVVRNSEVQSFTVDEIRIIAATLWTDPTNDPIKQLMLQRYMADFRAIQGFTIWEMAELHHKQKLELQSKLSEPFDGKTVVLTHHLPSFSLCHPRFGGDLDHGFASACDDLIESNNVSLWAFGHTHDHINRLYPSTQCVMWCNPTGYRSEWGNSFSGGHAEIIEI